MQFDRPLDNVLGARSKVALLRLLVRTRGEHTGRDLARLVDLDAKTCHTSLQALARQGVIEHRKAGTAILYSLNESHILVEDLLVPLFDRESTFLAAYAKDLRNHLKGSVVSLILFGSVVRGEERSKSDVDLVVIAANPTGALKAEEAADRAAVDLSSRYGNSPQVIVYDRESFRRKAREGDGLVSEVLRTGRVLEGKPLAEILKNVS